MSDSARLARYDPRMRHASVLTLALLVTSCRPSLVERRVYGAKGNASMSAADWALERQRVQARLEAIGVHGTVAVSGESLDVRLPRLAPDLAAAAGEVITRVGSLEFLPARAKTIASTDAAGVSVEHELWDSTASDYLSSPDRDAVARAAGEGALLQKTEKGWRSWEVDRAAGLSQPTIVDAVVQAGPDMGRPQVMVTFDPTSGTRFEEITGANIGRPVLIVLDGEVLSAPIVRDKISGGKIVITLGASATAKEQMQEAESLARVLRTGALPFALELRSAVRL